MSHANKWLNAGEQKHEDHTVWSTSSIHTVKADFTTAANADSQKNISISGPIPGNESFHVPMPQMLILQKSFQQAHPFKTFCVSKL